MTIRRRIFSAVLVATISSAAAEARGQGQPPPGEGTAAAQEVNTRPDNACTLNAGAQGARPCLGGAPGSCLTVAALRKLRDGTVVSLPARTEQLGAAEVRAEALQGALSAAKVRGDLLQMALDDTRQALASERARADKATEAAVTRSSGSRWAYVGLVAAGMGVGAGVALGIAYALKPAIGSSSASLLVTRGLRLPRGGPPLSRGFVIRSW